jgi:hypothetical protein
MLNINTYSDLLKTNIEQKSYKGHFYNGPMLPDFTLAVATGVVNTAVTLTGLVTIKVNIGVSAGVGILFSGTTISDTTRMTAIQLFNGNEGGALKDFCDAIGAATATHFTNAVLVSDTNGAALFPTFLGATNVMADAIVKAAPNFKGSQWPNFAKAIATGICQTIGTNGTGILLGAVGTGTGTGIVLIS